MAGTEDDGLAEERHGAAQAKGGLGNEQYRLEEKRLVRKVDWILMPILTVTLGLQVRLFRSCCR